MCKQQSNSESESDTEISSSILKYFKLDKYLPRNKFQSTFINKDLDSTKKKKSKKQTSKASEKYLNRICKADWQKGAKRQRRKINTFHILKL